MTRAWMAFLVTLEPQVAPTWLMLTVVAGHVGGVGQGGLRPCSRLGLLLVGRLRSAGRR